MIELRVSEITPRFPPTVRPTTPVSDVARAIRDSGVPAVVILDDESIAGIVTESDVVAMVAENEHPVDAETIMSSPVSTVSPSATLVNAADQMKRQGVRHLAIVDDGVYAGLLSTETLAPYLSRHHFDFDGVDRAEQVPAEGRDRLLLEQ